jgi:hypothetical protein
MATQAAVLAGFTTTCLIEIHIPDTTPRFAVCLLHFAAVVSICSNIACVSLSTITSIWGSGKALRGKDGSMDEAVDGMNKERGLIFFAFSLGLFGNLSTVFCACLIIMDFPFSLFVGGIVIFTAWQIYSNALRIQSRFLLVEAVRLDDLTNYPATDIATKRESSISLGHGGSGNNISNSGSEMTIMGIGSGSSYSSGATLIGRSRKTSLEVV